MWAQQDIFNQAIERFAAEQEEIRTAASFAAGLMFLTRMISKYTHFWAGNIAVGNLQHFLPVIVKMVETDSQKRLLSLHALKEVSLCEGVNTIETHAYMVFRW